MAAGWPFLDGEPRAIGAGLGTRSARRAAGRGAGQGRGRRALAGRGVRFGHRLRNRCRRTRRHPLARGARWAPGIPWVDDVEAPLYNMPAVEPDPPATPPWKSAEKMTRDDGQMLWGGRIRHNDAPPVKGAGSAIFLHVQAGPGVPTTGCTSMARPDLDTLVRWLDPARHPVLVQVVGAVL